MIFELLFGLNFVVSTWIFELRWNYISLYIKLTKTTLKAEFEQTNNPKWNKFNYSESY